MHGCIHLFVSMTLVCAVSATAYAQKFESKEEKQAYEKGLKHLEEKEFNLAAQALSQAVKMNPANAYSQYWLGMAYFEGGFRKKAVEPLTAAYKSNPNLTPELRLYLGMALQFGLEFDEAIKMLNEHKNQYKGRDRDSIIRLTDRFIMQCKNGKQLVANPVSVTIENLGPNVNTKFPDYAPVITADESQIFFTSRRPGNLGKDASDGLPYEDVWYSEYIDSAWTPAKNIKSPVNSIYHDATISVSADGATLLVYRDESGGGIFLSDLKGDKWGEPKSIGKVIDSKDYEPSAAISADRRTIVFTRGNVNGDLDLYISTKDKKDRWTEPKNLGPVVNTPYREDSPFLHPDGKTLYFSSKGHNSMGGYDIFKTVRQEDGSWSKPENLGYPINSPDDDLYFVVAASGRRAYYSSLKDGGYGDKDIYVITFTQPRPKVKAQTDTVVAQISTQPEQKVEESFAEMSFTELTLVKGQIVDETTQKPIEATIYIIDNETGDTVSVLKSNSATGKYLATLPSGKNYGISVQKDGYVFHSENFDLPKGADYAEVSKKITMKPLGFAVGSKIILKNIFYDFDKYTLRPTSIAELERLLKILEDNPKMRIRILSHTDSKGSDEYNMVLSNNRARAVVDWLISKGVAKDRLEYKGMGETEPIDTNDTDEGRQNNRRTEFEILSL
jgi:outer membrane protein OmpA-like peptidoglycan-associated protein